MLWYPTPVGNRVYLTLLTMFEFSSHQSILAAVVNAPANSKFYLFLAEQLWEVTPTSIVSTLANLIAEEAPETSTLQLINADDYINEDASREFVLSSNTNPYLTS